MKKQFPGRHCAICGKPGGTGFKMALMFAGLTGTHAHADCLIRYKARNAPPGALLRALQARRRD